MIVDEKSISKFGEIPKVVLDLAHKADAHGKSFSQWTSSLCVIYNPKLSGWMIIDNINRGIYDSIFYCTSNKKFYMRNVKDFLLYEYKDESYSKIHAMQYFLMGITENLVYKKPSERNLI